MKILFLIMGVISYLFAPAQQDPALRFSTYININGLHDKLAILSDANMEGRETGTEGQRKAAKWIESEFKRIGLKPIPELNGYQQYYPLYKDSMVGSTFSINGKKAVKKKDYIFNPQNVISGSMDFSEIVFAGFGIEDSAYNDYTNLNVKGKLVVVLIGEPYENGKFLISGTGDYSRWTYPGIRLKLKVAKENGARAVLIINPSLHSFGNIYDRYSTNTGLYYPQPEDQSGVPYGFISLDYAKKIFGQKALAHISEDHLPNSAPHIKKPSKVHLEFNRHREIIKASNVIGYIEGAEIPEEYLFITAHYDHLGTHHGEIYYGADDDGSGSAAVIQMAEAFMEAAKAGHRPRRSVVFMTVSGEEKGLWGSEYYTDHPLFPLDSTTADLNIDMIGRIDTERKKPDTLNYVYVIGHDKLSSDLPVINESMNNKYTRLTLDYKFDDPNDINQIYFRSDHYNFARKGVPVLFFYDGMLKADYHKPTDTIEKIEWDLLEKRTLMIFFTAWDMANREGMLKRDIPLPQSAQSRF